MENGKLENIHPLITVVVPVYNVEKYLEKCVISIINQTYTELEIILVDDGSTDASGTLCDELAKKDDRILVIHKPNGGLSDARNCGIQKARGTYIGLVDSDDYIAPDMYEMLYKNILKEEADVSVCSLYSCYEDKVEAVGNHEYKVINGSEMIRLSLEGKSPCIWAWLKLYKRELLLTTPFEKGRQYEDAIVIVDLFSKVDRVVIEQTPKYYYVHRVGSITTQKYTKSSSDVIYAWEKNLETVKEKYPEYLELAWYRVYWSYFVVLDRIIVSGSEEAKEDEKQIIQKIRKSYLGIIKNKRITKGKKMAVTALMFSEKIYAAWVKKREKAKKYVDL